MVFVAPAFLTAFTPLELACGRYIAYGLIAAGLMATACRAAAPARPRRHARMLKHALAGNIVYYMLLAWASNWPAWPRPR
jgi:hypothetical protein